MAPPRVAIDDLDVIPSGRRTVDGCQSELRYRVDGMTQPVSATGLDLIVAR